MAVPVKWNKILSSLWSVCVYCWGVFWMSLLRYIVFRRTSENHSWAAFFLGELNRKKTMWTMWVNIELTYEKNPAHSQGCCRAYLSAIMFDHQGSLKSEQIHNLFLLPILSRFWSRFLNVSMFVVTDSHAISCQILVYKDQLTFSSLLKRDAACTARVGQALSWKQNIISNWL